MKKRIEQLALVFLYLIAIAFSIKSLREPDLWWQIRTGEWILQNHQIPKQDIFSFTFNGTPWINIKWGSEVLFAAVANVTGPESVFVLQALVSCLLVFFMLRTCAATIRIESMVAVFISVIAMEYRIIGRPEMFSHLFTAVFLFLLLRNRQTVTGKIFWLTPLQIVWANFHEAFGIGIVLTAAFTAGAWLEYYLWKKKIFSVKRELPKKLTLLLLLQTAAVVINPQGIQLLARPLQILGQVYQNKYTTELFNILQPEYWQWNTYWLVGILTIGLLGTAWHFVKQKTKANRFWLFLEHFGPGYLLTLIAFTYLATTAYRNIAFLAIVFLPVLSFSLYRLWAANFFFKKMEHPIAITLCLMFLSMYALIVSNKYYALTKSRDRFGLEVLSSFNPVGAAKYIEQNRLAGNCFSDYLTSSYLLWELQPHFKTFIDLRDLDVFPPDFFSRFATAVTFPDEFQQLDSAYRFSHVVLYRPQFAGLHQFLFNQSRFKLAYADAVACVYIPKQTNTDSSQINFSALKPVPVSAFSSAFNKILNPFYSPYHYSKLDNNLPAAAYFLSVGNLPQAENIARQSTGSTVENYKANEILGEIYYQRALASATPADKETWLNNAEHRYRQSLNENDDFSAGYLGLGAVYFQRQNMVKALEQFELAIAADKNNLNAYNFAAECCKFFINQNSHTEVYLPKAIKFYLQSNRLNPDNPGILLQLGLLYFRNGNCDQTKKYLQRVKGYSGLSEAENKAAQDCLRKCGN